MKHEQNGARFRQSADVFAIKWPLLIVMALLTTGMYGCSSQKKGDDMSSDMESAEGSDLLADTDEVAELEEDLNDDLLGDDTTEAEVTETPVESQPTPETIQESPKVSEPSDPAPTPSAVRSTTRSNKSPAKPRAKAQKQATPKPMAIERTIKEPSPFESNDLGIAQVPPPQPQNQMADTQMPETQLTEAQVTPPPAYVPPPRPVAPAMVKAETGASDGIFGNISLKWLILGGLALVLVVVLLVSKLRQE